jgi:DeoR family glycerol-3-phosphate regulon repressor
MRPSQRQQWIAEMVGRLGAVSVDALAAELAVSAETIRRDLGLLDEQGVVRKVHGGATRPRMIIEGTFDERMAENTEAKRAIAAKTLDVIETDATVFIDTGSTTLICAQALAAARRLTVITNSVAIARTFAETGRSSDVFLLGGRFAAGNAETVGTLTIEQIAGFHADHALISPAAIDAESGLMNADVAEAGIARAMIARASHLVVAVDRSKMGKRATFTVAPLEAVDVLVSDGPIEGALRDRLLSCKVTIR